MNVLLIYLQPKDLPEVLDELEKINCDKLYLKYFPYPDVYKIAMKTIKEHPEYDYIFWLQNDIVLTREYFWQLCEDIKKYDFSILGASMNVDLSYKGFEKCAYCVEPINIRSKNNMPWVTLGDFNEILKVSHSGGAFICKRQLLIDHPLKGEGKSGYNADIVFSLELRENKIMYFLNPEIHLKHLRYCGKMLVGKKPPEINFVKN